MGDGGGKAVYFIFLFLFSSSLALVLVSLTVGGRRLFLLLSFFYSEGVLTCYN